MHCRVPLPRAWQGCKDPGKLVRKGQGSTCSGGAAGGWALGGSRGGWGGYPCSQDSKKTRVWRIRGGPGGVGAGTAGGTKLKRCVYKAEHIPPSPDPNKAPNIPLKRFSHIWNTCLQQSLYTHVLTSTIHSSRKAEMTHKFIHRMDKTQCGPSTQWNMIQLGKRLKL